MFTDHLYLLNDMNTLPLLDCAATYAELGVPVFPLKPGAKTPNCQHGVKDATTDIERVERWWKDNPDDNIGLACGVVFDVLDVDVDKEKPGLRNARIAEDAGLLDGWMAMQATPSGGRHLLFAPSEGMRNTVKGKLGLDVRASGGYIVAAPSVILGVRYEWTRAHGDGPWLPLPWDRIVALLDPPTPRPQVTYTGKGSIAGLVKTVLDAREGERNARLYWASCRAAAEGLDPSELRQAALSVGLPASEVDATIASAQRGVSA